MTAEKNKSAGHTADREISHSRVYDAPRELVWKVWTEPQHIAQWWGPNGFTNTIFKMDVRPGGEWEFIMHGPDGTDYKNTNIFVEVVPMERLIFDHVSQPNFRFHVTFEAEGARTRVSMRLVFQTAQQRDDCVNKYGAAEGLKQNLAKLDSTLARISTNQKVVLAREFNAPRPLMFKAWTDARQVQQWWGPRQFTNPICRWDAKPGGQIYVDMRGPEDVAHPCKGFFHQIIEPSKLVFTITAFENDKGQPQLEMLNTVTFSEQQGRTRMTLVAQVVSATPDVAGPISGMEAGWSSSLEKFAEVVAKG